MKIDGHKLLAIYASARSVIADEVCLVSATRLHREGQGWAFSDEASSRTVGWAHLVLTEALTTLQADLMQRRPWATAAVVRPHSPGPQPRPVVPTQHTADQVLVVPLDGTGRSGSVVKHS